MSEPEPNSFAIVRLATQLGLIPAAVASKLQEKSSADCAKLLGHFVDVCQALEYAHSRGVVHRDIKPDNIMIGQFGETLLVDWGLAKSLSRSGEPDGGAEDAEDATLPLNVLNESNQTQQGSVLGTPSYMSPEQARGAIAELGPTSDVYSLGATLCFLLTGQPPVAKQSVLAMLEQVRSGKVLAPRDLQPNVPKALDAICRKAMSLEIENRYESAATLASDIERLRRKPSQSSYSRCFAVLILA